MKTKKAEPTVSHVIREYFHVDDLMSNLISRDESIEIIERLWVNLEIDVFYKETAIKYF